MKKYLLIVSLLFCTSLSGDDGFPDDEQIQEYVEERTPHKNLKRKHYSSNKKINISVVGQGVAPAFASSPAQAYSLAKRAALSDAYRLLAERVMGVEIEGKDTIKNMAIKNSVLNTRVSAMIRNATVVETTFKNGMCEVEMEVAIDPNIFK